MGFFVFCLVVAVFAILIRQGRLAIRLETLENDREVLQRRLDKLEPTPPKPELQPVPEAEAESIPERPLERVHKEKATPPAPPVSPPPLPTESATPPPPPKPEPEPTQEARPPLLAKLRPILERLKLWPPSIDDVDGTSPEVAMAVFWTTRIGLVLMIIAAVFFGVHFSQAMPNWVRAVTLFAVASAVFGLGVWLERRFAQFGRLISAGGLALAFFASFALFGVPATKVTDQPLISLLAQVGSILLAIGWSVFRRDEMIATMSIFLGYIACWFSTKYGMSEFALGSLLVLAVTGAGLFTWRGWRWPQVVAIGGTWIGIYLLARFPWQNESALPSFGMLLAASAALLAILETGSRLASQRTAAISGLWKKALAVANSSSGVFVGILAIYWHYPDQLSHGYLGLALLLGALATLRFWPEATRHRGIAETFLLKAAALLCLYFVAEFEGPVRWLALGLQTLALFVAWKRTRSVWIEFAAFSVFIVSLAFVQFGVFDWPDEPWTPLSIRAVVGWLALWLLGGILSLHSRWADRTHAEPLRFLRGALAIWVGVVALQLTFVPGGETGVVRVWFALGFAAAVSGVTILTQRAPALIAGVLVLTLSCWTSVFGEFSNGPDSVFEGGVMLEHLATLFFLAIVTAAGAELCFRLWKSDWPLGDIMRLIFGLLALSTLAATFYAAHPESNGLAEHLTVPVFAMGVAALIWQLSRRFPEPHPQDNGIRLFFAVAAGVVTIALARAHWAGSDEPSAWLCIHLALASAILFSTGGVRKARVSAVVAGLLPLLAALATLLFSARWSMGMACLAATTIGLVALSTAFCAWASVGTDNREKRLLDGTLHLIWMIALVWLAWEVLDDEFAILAPMILAIGTTIAAKRAPFRMLSAFSGMPIALSMLPSLWVTIDHAGDSIVTWPIWLAAGLGAVWLVLWHYFFRTKAAHWAPTYSAMVGVLWTVLCFHAAPEGWENSAIAGFALLGAGIWRVRRIHGLLSTLCVMAGFAFLHGLARFQFAAAALDLSLAAVLSTAAFLALTGVVLDGRRGRMESALVLFPIAGLLLAFLGLSSALIGVDEWITVSWGASGIILFLLGLIAGLRGYRIVGLVGLAACIVRMFAVDIDDTLYRIIAFFAISVVLLMIGFLYHRFRDFISAADRRRDH